MIEIVAVTIHVLAILCVLEVAMISGIAVLDRRTRRARGGPVPGGGRIPMAIVRRLR